MGKEVATNRWRSELKRFFGSLRVLRLTAALVCVCVWKAVMMSSLVISHTQQKFHLCTDVILHV